MVSSSLDRTISSPVMQTLWMPCPVLAMTAAEDAAMDLHTSSGKARSRHPKEWSSVRETTGLAHPSN